MYKTYVSNFIHVPWFLFWHSIMSTFTKLLNPDSFMSIIIPISPLVKSGSRWWYEADDCDDTELCLLCCSCPPLTVRDTGGVFTGDPAGLPLLLPEEIEWIFKSLNCSPLHNRTCTNMIEICVACPCHRIGCLQSESKNLDISTAVLDIVTDLRIISW